MVLRSGTSPTEGSGHRPSHSSDTGGITLTTTSSHHPLQPAPPPVGCTVTSSAARLRALFSEPTPSLVTDGEYCTKPGADPALGGREAR